MTYICERNKLFIIIVVQGKFGKSCDSFDKVGNRKVYPNQNVNTILCIFILYNIYSIIIQKYKVYGDLKNKILNGCML